MAATTSNPSSSNDSLTLYSYFRSSCSARVRTAATLKNIPLSYHYVPLLKDAQIESSYLALNPSASVPTLVTSTGAVITQSMSILEYLEEAFPSHTPLLLPSDPVRRAAVRDLANIIACDTQPVTNLRVLKGVAAAVASAGGDGAEEAGAKARADWAKSQSLRGLQAYEHLARRYAGKYSVGDEITLADVCLAPAVENALRFGVDLEAEGLEVVKRVFEALKGVDSFVKAGWRAQGDTPEELR